MSEDPTTYQCQACFGVVPTCSECNGTGRRSVFRNTSFVVFTARVIEGDTMAERTYVIPSESFSESPNLIVFTHKGEITTLRKRFVIGEIQRVEGK